MARALVLEAARKLALRDIDLPDELGPEDVRIAIDTVGVCGSDVHYYTHGKIGPFVVKQPMVLGHEAAGIVTEIGAAVTHLALGDRVCMEPGIPNGSSKASKLGVYNVDPAVQFWATPPVHGCLTPSVVHPAAFTFKLPDHVSFAEGAMVEPFAIGMQAAAKARIKPGDVALVTGAGPIGVMVALAALAGGCAKVFVSDLVEDKLAIAAGYDNIHPILIPRDNPAEVLQEATEGWGADVVFECAGAAASIQAALEAAAPAGCVVWVGMPVDPVPVDIVLAQSRELRMETVFRYANMYDRAIALLASGKVDLKPLISATFPFEDSIAAFDRAVEARPTDVKIQIKMGAS
ncbi:D-xylulose reductase [Dinoroseobacter shibae DFL 12 = DSM 16493]|jgi:D-xylulose reductase|uniref:D-xylulose reductase n=2 Tax=Pseudomonadota TaxID=1224 RepID=A8LPH4_DINSH|nr:NAD(P)-dependent alcohol dehydrogenase [Dinoroseobacter shibae]ABV92297.1 D-xylulose reductase [Dinoroseobacter shibae DFL 12 = DSM 16493]URF48493.1 NAD(P)-dependent alcohol dehydrogenase [Dinoroseobacter shibae]URF52806.1 NAD(P)-dependent alcohol dehydrogenase [Dinoroseobacter shibae]